MKKTERARVYRFHDLVALTTELEGVCSKTIYLDPDTARHLARVIGMIERDITHQPKFSESKIGSRVVEPVDHGPSVGFARMRRQ